MLKLENPLMSHHMTAATLLLIALSSPACTGTRMESMSTTPEEISKQLEVGDYVRIWTNDGAWQELEITQVTSTAVSGGEAPILVSDIERIEVRTFDGWDTARRTGSAIGGVVLGVLFFAVLFFAGG